MANNITNEEALIKWRECSQALDDAFESSNDLNEKSQIFRMSRAVTNEIEKLIEIDLNKRNQEYKTLTTGVTKINKQLNDLKDKIDEIILNVERAARAASALETAIAIAAKFAI